MKILRLYPKISPMPGGMEAHIAELSKRQVLLGHQVVVGFNMGSRISSDDIQVLPNINLTKKFKSPFGFFVFYLLMILRLLVDRKKYDVLHIHGDWSSYAFAPVLRLITGAKTVAFSFHAQIQDGISHKTLLPITLKFCDVIFCNGHDAHCFISRHANAVFQPSGVKDLFFSEAIQPRKENQICCISVLRAVKNVETVLDIAEMLPEYQFVIAGDGECRARLEELALTKQLNNVKFIGAVDSYGVKVLLDSSILFLSTSLEEGTPTAAMEAMACGLPIVSSGAGGLSAVIESGIDGFVIEDEYRSASLYVEAIQEVMQPAKYSKFSKSVKSKSKKFNWDNVAERITNALNNKAYEGNCR